MCDIVNRNVWCEFDGRKSKRTYRIEDVREEHYEELSRCMIEYFLKEEPTCKYLGASNDQECIDELKEAWMECYKCNMSLVCLDESGNVTGFLLLTTAKKTDPPAHTKNKKWTTICNIINYISKQKNPFSEFKIDEYLTDMGLLVLPEFRGEGIAEKLLNTCEAVAKVHKLSVLAMTFSSTNSQNLAMKLGFSELYSIDFAELRRIDPERLGIDNIEEHTKDIRYLYKKYS